MLQLLGTVLEMFQAANSQSGLDKDMEVSASRLMPWKNHYSHAQKLHFTDCTFSPPVHLSFGLFESSYSIGSTREMRKCVIVAFW